MQNEIKGLVKLPVRYDEPRSSFIDANGLVIFNTKSFYPYYDRHKLGHALAALINAKEEEMSDRAKLAKFLMWFQKSDYLFDFQKNLRKRISYEEGSIDVTYLEVIEEYLTNNQQKTEG